MFFNIKYRMYFEKMMYTSSPAMNGLNIHVHVLSCAGPPRTVQNFRQVKICRQLTERAYILCLDIKLPHAFPLYGSNYSCDFFQRKHRDVYLTMNHPTSNSKNNNASEKQLVTDMALL